MRNISLFKKKKLKSPAKKVLYTLLYIVLYRIGNIIPIENIDQDALRRTFLESENKAAFLQVLNMYSGAGSSTSLVNWFSLGIIPYINASIFIDLLTQIVPSLEKLYQEEGEAGKRQIEFYKKGLSLVFAVGQVVLLISYIKPYLYDTSVFPLVLLGTKLIVGAMTVVYLSQAINNKGIGNGQSVLILLNILGTFLGKNESQNIQINSINEILILVLMCSLILCSQTLSGKLPIVAAKQIGYLKKNKTDESTEGKILQQADSLDVISNNNLLIKYNQAGIFPLIIASNVSPFLNILIGNRLPKSILTVIYYLLIIVFNYFYTTLFWDPNKVADQLRKTSVALRNIRPGEQTLTVLKRTVTATSLLGGFFLCSILILYEYLKTVSQSPLLNQINISSLMIVIGVVYELQKSLQALYKNIRFDLEN